jgi:hypothetical protein
MGIIAPTLRVFFVFINRKKLDIQARSLERFTHDIPAVVSFPQIYAQRGVDV